VTVSTEERIKELMASNLNWAGSWSEVDASYPLLEKQVVDSLGMITLISLLEDEFDVEIDDGDVVPGNFRTITDIASLVESKQA
jgi:acyl carrier protein